MAIVRGYDSQNSAYREYVMIRKDLATVADLLAEPFDKRISYSNDELGISVTASVHPLVCLTNFLDNLNDIQDELAGKVTYRAKKNDLYDFSQSSDLISSRSTCPQIAQFRSSLLTEVRPMIERIIGRSLSDTHLDLSSQIYVNHQYLLTHDDRLDSRRVAFVLYLVTPEWDDELDGGHLDFLFTDWKGEPTVNKTLPQRFLPIRNAFVFFEVGMSSHHQVAEVLGPTPRISISGWFHDSTEQSTGLPPSFPQDHIRADYHQEQSSDKQITLRGVLTPEFHLQLTSYVAFRQPDARHIVTPHESFHYYQEAEGEPFWMRQLMQKSFTSFIASLLPGIPLDWPTRPILKIYNRHDYNSGGITKEDSIRVFIFIGDSEQDNTLIINTDGEDYSIDRGNNISVIEIQFIRRPLNPRGSDSQNTTVC